jgi:hypothetical protein
MNGELMLLNLVLLSQITSMRKLFFAIILFSICLSSQAHKFYMSLTEMQYNAKTGSLEIMIKLFTDDIEKAVEKNIDYGLFLGTEKEHPTTDSLMEDYFRRHFKITTDNNPIKLTFLGKEAERDYTWFYVEVPDFKPTNSHNLTNTMLIRTFDQQSNKVNYYHNGETTSLSLHKDRTSGSF